MGGKIIGSFDDDDVDDDDSEDSEDDLEDDEDGDDLDGTWSLNKNKVVNENSPKTNYEKLMESKLNSINEKLESLTK